jgi:CRISPR-associated protein Cas1
MHRQVVEVSTPGRQVSLDRGFLLVHERQEERARLPLDDIGAVLITTPGATVTTNLAAELAARGTPLIVCGRNYRPTAILWAVEQHHEQAGRFLAQMRLSVPRKKRLWQDIVRQKVLNQHEVLERRGRRLPALKRLAQTVKSGDPSNVEAQAARAYWPALLGTEFRRDPSLEGTNAQLNYGYAILRAAVARAVSAAGLHPSMGIFHCNPKNSFQLVDDLMEPFRPIVDHEVASLEGSADVSPAVKKRLAALGETECEMHGERGPLGHALHRFVLGYVDVITGDSKGLVFPQVCHAADGST